MPSPGHSRSQSEMAPVGSTSYGQVIEYIQGMHQQQQQQRILHEASWKLMSSNHRSPLPCILHAPSEFANAISLPKTKPVTIQAVVTSSGWSDWCFAEIASPRLLLDRSNTPVQRIPRRFWPASYRSSVPVRCAVARGPRRPCE